MRLVIHTINYGLPQKEGQPQVSTEEIDISQQPFTRQFPLDQRLVIDPTANTYRGFFKENPSDTDLQVRQPPADDIANNKRWQTGAVTFATGINKIRIAAFIFRE